MFEQVSEWSLLEREHQVYGSGNEEPRLGTDGGLLLSCRSGLKSIRIKPMLLGLFRNNGGKVLTDEVLCAEARGDSRGGLFKQCI